MIAASRLRRVAILAGIAGLIASRMNPQMKRNGSGADESTGDSELWMFNQYAKSHDMAGGTRHFEFSTILRAQGWTTTIFATPYSLKTAAFERPVSKLKPSIERNEQDVRFVWLYTTPYASNGASRYLNMLSFMANAGWAGVRRSKPSLIIGSSPHLLSALAAWGVSRRHRVPFVLEIRDLWPDTIIQLGVRNPAIIRPLQLIERFLYERADAIIALTDGIRTGIIKKSVPAEKVHMIPNGTQKPAPLDAELRAADRRRYSWDDKTIAIWMGAHNPANGLEFVVEAARQLRDRENLRIVFVGDGSDKPKLIAQAAELPNVQFLDQVPKNDVSRMLRAADIGMLHSRAFEAFTGARPNKLFDYMSAGLPIVCAVPGEASALVQEAGCGIDAEWENAASIAGGIAFLADDEPFRRRLGAQGFQHVIQKHSREASAIALNQLLREVERNHQITARQPHFSMAGQES